MIDQVCIRQLLFNRLQIIARTIQGLEHNLGIGRHWSMRFGVPDSLGHSTLVRARGSMTPEKIRLSSALASEPNVWYIFMWLRLRKASLQDHLRRSLVQKAEDMQPSNTASEVTREKGPFRYNALR